MMFFDIIKKSELIKMAKPVIAILYDFDKTLCTEDMQNYSFIPNLGLTPKEFWSKTGVLGNNHSMDKILAYMYEMLYMCKQKNIKLTKEYLNSLGKNIKYFPGVSTWFSRINAFGESLGVKIEHYIVSSGTKEIIDGTTIAHEFKRIYGCEFLYDEETNEAIWPKMAINFTLKTQFIFRISKGAFDIIDEEKLNSDTPDKARHVFYRNMIYIGDGMTDIPCMQVVKDKGGKSIAVYRSNDEEKVMKLVNDSRINFVCLADYSQNSSLEKFVQMSIENMVLYEKLRQKEMKQLQNFQNRFEGETNV